MAQPNEVTPQMVMDDLLQVLHRIIKNGSLEQRSDVLPLVQAWATISSTLQIWSGA